MNVVTDTPPTASLPIVRTAVRDLLTASPAYLELPGDDQRNMAQLMVSVCQTAAALLLEELESTRQVQELTADDSRSERDFAPARTETFATSAPQTASTRSFSAGDEFSGKAVDRVAGTVQAIQNAVSFPRFVTELINGVFKAMIEANVTQMQSFIELLNNVSASLEGFADVNVGADRARQWLADSFPGAFEVNVDADELEAQRGLPPDEREPVESQVRLRPNAQMPTEAALRARLGVGEEESIPSGDPERALVPLARRALAAQRQQMLATMVMLGMQRIVVDSGRIHASMRFHVDASSAAQQDRGSMFDFRNTASVAGQFGAGPWGVSAAMTNTIGYASTENTSTTERQNAEVEMNSSVELVFHTDYLPLNRVTNDAQADRIRTNSLNPKAEELAAREARETRRTADAGSQQERRDLITDRLRATQTVASPQLPAVPAINQMPSSPSSPRPASGNTPANPTPASSNTPINPSPASGGSPANRSSVSGSTPASPNTPSGGPRTPPPRPRA